MDKANVVRGKFSSKRELHFTIAICDADNGRCAEIVKAGSIGNRFRSVSVTSN